jgi:hypothetical protein
VSIQKSANLFEIKAREKFNRKHTGNIPRIKFFAQHRYRENWPFLDGHYTKRQRPVASPFKALRDFKSTTKQSLRGHARVTPEVPPCW